MEKILVSFNEKKNGFNSTTNPPLLNKLINPPLFFFQLIDPGRSSVVMSPTKVEIKLRKAEISSWSNLELRKETKENSTE